ncbi:hypothetical protein [Vulcanisaeta sp. JCM 14467]|uniref:hypothetical protein n=1 Tax=Vulcanisaeta sp. JCM 14467 TaxID=1295370 RepID=UPI0006D29E85|nr:hypothetical protein [Vulcanisaeta sp. JCM 14467]
MPRVRGVGHRFGEDVVVSRRECGDLPRLIVEYLIARCLEEGYGPLTPMNVVRLLAAALFINPDAKDLVEAIDVHELARCFMYRVYKYPVYSQVVIEAIKELWRDGRVEVRLVPVLENGGVTQVIDRGVRFRGSREVIADLENGQYTRYGGWEGLIDRINNAINRFGSYSTRKFRKYLHEKLGISTLYIESGADLIKYVGLIRRMREEGKKVSEEDRFIVEL